MDRLKQGLGDLKKQAGKSAETVRKTVESGIAASKNAADQARAVLNRDTLKQGVDLGARSTGWLAAGTRMFADGVKMASQVLDSVSSSLKDLGNKLDKK